MADQETPKKLGRYEIIGELGKGAMGVVYEGKDPNIGRRVAIKTARRDVMEATGMAEEMMVRFLREAQAAGTLNHPNIITIYDAAEEDGIAYIAMEFLEGSDLREALDERQRFSVEDTVEIGAIICEALAVAHEHGIVHRDMKPANIMMLKGNNIKIADFGIARMSDSSLTQEGALIGTPHYMSPEQFMGQKVDGRSDLFSVANILYEMLTGEKPFTGEALSTVMHHVIRTEPTPPQELNFSVNEHVGKVIMKALSKRPDQRYPDGRSMAAALRESLKPSPSPAILFGNAAEADATIVSQAGGETILSQDGSATVASASPPPPLAPTRDETVAGAAPAAGKHRESAGSPVTGQEVDPSAIPAPMEKRPNYLLFGGIGAAVLVVIVVGAVMMGGGGDGVENGGGTTPPVGNGQTINYLKTLDFVISRAKTEDAYDKFNVMDAPFDDVRSDVETISAHVIVRDAEGNSLFENSAYSSMAEIRIPEKVEKVEAEILIGGTLEKSYTLDVGELRHKSITKYVVLPPKP